VRPIHDGPTARDEHVSGGSGTGSTTIRFVHTDNLGGSSVVTDPQGAVSEAEDFYPYGTTRIDTKTNYGGEKRKHAGTEYDALPSAVVPKNVRLCPLRDNAEY
jgi:hypothetical protein